jgi:ElaB/YqjD/DUF883 family membrane-anchored ribosome-binding protein
MPKTSNIYDVTEIKQLINLNKDKTNFSLDFEVKSVDGSPFKALVVSESNLNSGEELEYKDVQEGHITGNILNDKGVYQNYFLLLKSDTPTKCEVILDIKDVPLNPQIQNMIQQQKEQEMNERRKKEQETSIRKKENENVRVINARSQDVVTSPQPFKDQTNWVLIGVVAVIGLLGMWYIFSVSKKPSKPALETPAVTVPTSAPVNLATTVQAPVIPPPPISIPVNPPIVDGLGSGPVSELSLPPIVPKISTGVTTAGRNSALFDKLNSYFGDE